MVLNRQKAKKLSDAAPIVRGDALRVSLALKDWIYKNSILDCVHQELLKYATSNTSGLVVALTGMRRTQKSTVVKATRMILEERALESGKNRGSMIIGVPPFDGNSDVDWKACGRDLLEPMLGDLVDKVIPIPPLTQGAVNLKSAQQKKGTAQAYLSAIEDDMRQEGIPLFIDHADFIYQLTSAKRVKLFIARIRRLAEKGGMPVILIGNPGLALLCESARDNLTIKLIEMPTYNTDSDGIRAFAEQLAAFELFVGPEFCERGLLKNNAERLTKLADARIGAIMDALKLAFDRDCAYGGKLTIERVEEELKTAGPSSAMYKKERGSFEDLTIIKMVRNSNLGDAVSDANRTGTEKNEADTKSPHDPDPSARANEEAGGDRADDANVVSVTSDGEATTSDRVGDGNEVKRKRRRRHTRIGRTKQSNRPIHPYGDPES